MILGIGKWISSTNLDTNANLNGTNTLLVARGSPIPAYRILETPSQMEVLILIGNNILG